MDKSIYNSTKLILLISLFAIVLFVWTFMHYIHFDNEGLSYIFLIVYGFCLITIWYIGNKMLTIFFLFFLTFGLFIGGRFFTCLIDPVMDPFEPTFFLKYSVSYVRKIVLMDFIIGFMLFIVWGYYFALRYPLKLLYRPTIRKNEIDSIDKFLLIISPAFTILILYTSVRFVIEGLEGGYLAHFVDNVNSEYSGSGLAKWAGLLSSLFLGLAIVYGTKKTKLIYISLFLVNALANLFVGSRSSFGVFMLVLIWLYSYNRKISLLKSFFYVIGGMLLLLWLFSFSIREISSDKVELSIIDSIISFFYTQGISLMVFDASHIIDDYPVLPYFQTFIPGSSIVYSLFSEKPLMAYDVSFSNYMCYNLNPELFLNGSGLGWSVMSDLFIFSGGCFVSYLLLSFLLGSFFGTIEYWAMKVSFYRYMLISLSSSFLLLPRGGLFGIFPLIFYIVLIWILIFPTKKIASICIRRLNRVCLKT